MVELLSRDELCLIAQAQFYYEQMSEEAKAEFEEAIGAYGPSPALIAALFLCIGLCIGVMI